MAKPLGLAALGENPRAAAGVDDKARHQAADPRTFSALRREKPPRNVFGRNC